MWRLAVVIVLCTSFCGVYGEMDTKHFELPDAAYLKDTFSLINRSAEILCSFRATTIYVYFENHTSAGNMAFLLKKLNECGTSFISLRNKYKTEPLESIKDDGILMYLALMIKNASQQIDLGIVKKRSASKHRSHFIVIVEDSRDIDEFWLRTAFEKFWKIWVLNAVIMFWRDNDIRIFTFSPFSNRFLRQLPTDVKHRDHLFPLTMPNMNGRDLKICLYPDEVRALFQSNGRIFGADGFMTTFVANRLNATRVIKLPSGIQHVHHRVSLSGNTSGDFCFSELARGASDMALNTRFLNPDAFKGIVEHTVVYGRDDLCVLVPKAPTASLFWNLFRSFQIPVWAAIVLMLLVTYAFCRTMLPVADQLLIKLYSNMLTQPLAEVPPRIPVRLFLIFWFSYCLLISGAYKCNLTSNLVFRVSLPEINNFLDLADSQYDMLIYARHQSFIDKFIDTSESHLCRIKQKAIPVSDDFLRKKLDENDLSYAYLEKSHVAHFRVNSRRHTHHGRPLFHLMKACPIPFQSVYIVPYGSPYLGILDTLVRRAHEHGFVEYWGQVMDTQFKQSGKSVVRNSANDDDPVVLRFAHLQAAFCILALGLTIGAGVLAWELYRVYGIGRKPRLRTLRNALLRR